MSRALRVLVAVLTSSAFVLLTLIPTGYGYDGTRTTSVGGGSGRLETPPEQPVATRAGPGDGAQLGYHDRPNVARAFVRSDRDRLAARSALGSAPHEADVGLSSRGLRPAPGTRAPPEGVPDSWRIAPADSPGGVWYYDPTNKGNAIRVMQGNRNSPYPTSRSPYVRWQRDGHALDVHGNKLPSRRHPDAHIPLQDFRFVPGVFE